MRDNFLTAKASTIIRRSPAEVFAALTDADRMSKFWFTRTDSGLQEGETSKWALGSADDAFSFDVVVKELREPEKIVIEWDGADGNKNLVTWSFVETEHGDTFLTIEETGFSGDRDAVVGQVLDSTGGFNQVIIAMKAFVEHGVEVNVVADHAH
jgi:uncharacterized protein YndB with AHSA1/START domain